METPTRLDRLQSAMRVSRIVLVLVLLALVPLLVFTSAARVWQLYTLSGLMAGLVIVTAVTMYLVQHDHQTRGIALLLVAMMVIVLTMPLLFDGIGVLMGLLTIFVVWQIANATLTSVRAGQAMVVGLLAGIMAVLLDLLDLGTQMVLPNLTALFGVLSFVIILAFGFLILRNYRDYSVRTKLLSVALFIILLIVSTTTVLTGEAIRRTLTEEVGGTLQVLARSQAFAVSELLGRQVTALEALTFSDVLQETAVIQAQQRLEGAIAFSSALDAQWQQAGDDDPLVQDRLNNPAAVTLRQFQERFEANRELFITDQYGGLVAASNRTTDYYQGDEAWWQSAYDNGRGRIYISEPTFDSSSDTFGLIMAVPIYAPDGEVVGVLRSTYALTELLGLLNEGLDLTDSARATLLMGEQELDLTQSVPLVQPTDVDSDLVTLLNQGEAVQAVYRGAVQFMSMASVTTLSHVAAVDELGWQVFLYQTEATALRPLGVQQRLSTLLGVLLAVVGGLIAAYAGNVLSQPIAVLTETAVRVRNGDFEARAKVNSSDETGILAETFNAMTMQLQATLQNLDFRVRERTRALEVAAQIGRRISTILDEGEMITAVVEQTQKAFNYYHVHIYLLDKNKNQLLMASGTGQPGISMRRYGHHINLGEGLVGRAAATNITILASDVTREPRWLPNKWLPETRAELAVPIATEKEVLGVLDVQRTTIGSLTEADANVLQLIANQVAIALQNARQYVLTQQRAERQVLINQIGQQIQNATSIDEALQVAVRELGRALGTDYTQVHLTEELPTNRLHD
ncbi:MAG: GAF domain-containing protein [Anaerolineales bacterium]|nr:GAF domain-containing protein [Anaerolineales bacterium]